LPTPHDLDLGGLDIDHTRVADLLGIDHEEWQKELAAHKTFFDSLGGVVPKELLEQREQLVVRFKE
jgi:phosphoenolpyruvate carboxykinase (GTP)